VTAELEDGLHIVSFWTGSDDYRVSSILVHAKCFCLSGRSLSFLVFGLHRMEPIVLLYVLHCTVLSASLYLELRFEQYKYF